MANPMKLPIAAMSVALIAQAEIAEARVAYVCPQLNTDTKALSVRIDSGCITGMARYKDNSLSLKVDQNHAMIAVTGDINYHPIESPIVTADCAGAKSITLEATGIEARRYNVTYNGERIGLSDLMKEPKPNACLSASLAKVASQSYPVAHASIYKDWANTMIPAWAELRSSNPLTLLAPLISGHPESNEGRPTLSISFGKRQWSRYPVLSEYGNEPFLGVSIERHGFLDDSVSGDRHFAELRYNEGEWRVANLWSQSLCARGARSGQWSSEPCV